MVILWKKIQLFNQNDSVVSGFLYSQDFFWPDWNWLYRSVSSLRLLVARMCACAQSVKKHTGARRSVQRMDSLMCYVSAVNPQIMRGCWAQLIWFNRSLRLALLEAQAFPRNAGPPASWRSALPPQLTGRQHFRSFFLWRKHLCDNNILPLNQQSHISSTG